MRPARDNSALVDLVETILNKGVVVSADVIISVAGVPLVGINLRAAIAGMETMLRYGMMQAWDERVREEYAKEIESTASPILGAKEEIAFQAFGSYYEEGLYDAWRSGELYLTNERLFIRRKAGEVLFQAPLEAIEALETKERDGIHELVLVFVTGEVARLRAGDIDGLRKALENGRGERALLALK